MKQRKMILAAALFAAAVAHAQDGPIDTSNPFGVKAVPAPAVGDGAFGDAVVLPPPPPPPLPPFEVHREDGNMRVTIGRWAKTTGWTFQPEYWAVDRDIPVIADASLGTDFKGAVRQLMHSTELTALPLKPCFYTNNVVRIVPINEKCNRAQE